MSAAVTGSGFDLAQANNQAELSLEGCPRERGHARSQSAGLRRTDRSGLADLSGRAFLGGYETQEDRAAVRVRFLDGEDHVTGVVTLGPVTSAQRNDQTGLIQRASSATVPAGTRRAVVTLTCTRFDFSSNDGYTDNLSLKLSLSP